MLVARHHHKLKKNRALSGFAFDLTIRVNERGEIFLSDNNARTSVNYPSVISLVSSIESDLQSQIAKMLKIQK